MNRLTDNPLPIAVFDSGMGGVSVLRELMRLMPNEDYLYYGDSANAPYGTKSVQEVRALTLERIGALYTRGIKAAVIACNTATSAAVNELRQRFADIPVIGMEPAVKPAVLAHPHGTVLVLATPLTLREEKFTALTKRFEDECDLIKLPAPELVTLVEQNKMGTAELRQYLETLFAPLDKNKIDCLVLGCTHFPFAKREIRAVLGPRPVFFDGAVGEAKYTKVVLEERKLRAPADAVGGIRFESSDPQKTNLLEQLFAFDL